VAKDELILYSDRGMGNGIIEGIRDIVYVVPEKFNKMQTRQLPKRFMQSMLK
jgi:hypothetical protein